MASYGTILSVYGFLTSRAFHRVQEHAIRTLGEKVMVVQRHEEMKQYKGAKHLRARGADFWVLLKPLVSKFRLRRRIRKLEYDGIYLVCFGCGMFSHRKETCPFEILVTTVPIV